jgi:hypothetical protein
LLNSKSKAAEEGKLLRLVFNVVIGLVMEGECPQACVCAMWKLLLLGSGKLQARSPALKVLGGDRQKEGARTLEGAP